MAVISRTGNPVFWQEFTHQMRSAPRATRIGKILGPLSIVVILVGVPLTLTQLELAIRNTREIALLAIWVVHALVAVRCVVAGANAISREHIGQTWDALVLTGLSARRILLGKWLAAMRRVAPWMLALGTVRLMMLPVFTLAFTHRVAYLWFGRSGSGYYSSYEDGAFSITWLPEAMLIAVIMTVVLTFLEVACCTALGLFASAVTRRGALATVLGIGIRFAPVALFAAFTRYEIGPMVNYRWLRFTPFALADGGTSPLYQLVLPLMPWTRDRYGGALHGLTLATLLIAVLLIAALVGTLIAVRRSGAMPEVPRSAAESARAHR